MSGLDSEGFFARKLASNDSRTRAKTLRRLKKWMTARCENGFTELQMMKLWKGLHVCMWHSDKPLVQEELADSLASFIHVLKNREVVLLFIKCFFAIMAREWHGIDRLRLDKFYMLMRRVLRQSFQHLADKEWEDSYVKSLTKVLAAGPLNPDLSKTCSGIQLHVLEVYLPELLAVAATSVIPGDCSCWLLQPCCELLARTKE
jgi:ribosomal RNA-processing protein 1